MRKVLATLTLLSFVVAACATGAPTAPPDNQSTEPSASEPVIPIALTVQASLTAEAAVTPDGPPEDDRPSAGALREFSTDFSRHSVPYSEILSGGVPKDGIRSIDAPRFEASAQAAAWLKPVEPVILVELNGAARAYPLQILTWHEIVNDTLGGVPVVVTFCPLCNTAIAFERRINGQTLDFGATGRLRYANLLMYDRQTESWWQQATGEALVGEFTGAHLAFVPASIIAWSDFLAAYPQGQVLSRDTGFNMTYGRNPYVGYDDANIAPFTYTSWLSSYTGPATPSDLPPVARVLTVDLNGEAVAYPYEVLEPARVANDTVGGRAIVVLWAGGTASALHAAMVADGRDVGAAAAYARGLSGQTLTFVLADDQIQDQETGSVWNVLGQATAGPLAGQQLEPVVAVNHFWFSWAAFKPETRIYLGAGQ